MILKCRVDLVCICGDGECYLCNWAIFWTLNLGLDSHAGRNRSVGTSHSIETWLHILSWLVDINVSFGLFPVVPLVNGVGTFGVSTGFLGSELDITFFRVIAFLDSLLVIFCWIILSVLTIRSVFFKKNVQEHRNLNVD